MITGRIAIVGSTNRGDSLIQAETKKAAYALGKALAKKGLRILVYFDEPNFLEAEVVHGYLDSGTAAVNSIEVRYPKKLDSHNVPIPAPFSQSKDPAFAFNPDENPEWEISFYRSLEEIGGMVVMQGGSSTLIAGVVALGYNKPVLPCSGFGGTAVKLASILSERGQLTPAARSQLQGRPQDTELSTWADQGLNIMLQQAEAIEAKRQEQAKIQASVRHRETLYTIIAAIFAIIALGLCLLNWDNARGLSPSTVRILLFCVAGTSGVTGAMLWSVVPFLRRKASDVPASFWGTIAAGFIVACFTTAVYLIAQERGFPDFEGAFSAEKIATLKAEYLAKLLPSVMLTAVVTSMTLDRAFKQLLRHRGET